MRSRLIGTLISITHLSKDGQRLSNNVLITRCYFLNQYRTRYVQALCVSASFLTNLVCKLCPTSWAREHQPKNMVYAPHWYDLNALFAKAFGDFTVNVQGISRVSSSIRLRNIVLILGLIGHVSSESLPLGTEGSSG